LKGREWSATSWGLSEAREAPCLPAGLPLAIERDVIWNLASGEATSILELATATAAVAGRRVEVRYQRGPSRDVDRLLLSNAALSATGLSGPPLALAEGLYPALAEAAQVLPVVTAAPSYRQAAPRPASVPALSNRRCESGRLTNPRQ